jgi:hypothetical protein
MKPWSAAERRAIATFLDGAALKISNFVPTDHMFYHTRPQILATLMWLRISLMVKQSAKAQNGRKLREKRRKSVKAA